MPNVDLSQMSHALAVNKKKLHRQMTDPVADVSALREAFHKGVESRRKAWDALGAIAQPYTPSYVTIDTPFLIRAYRQGEPTTALLLDSYMGPLKSEARFRSEIEDYTFTGGILNEDEVSFYFLWQNDTAGNAVIDVESSLMLFGRWWVRAKSGLLWSPWSPGSAGHAKLKVSGELSLWEWWNQPPTHPLRQASQLQQVMTQDISGGWSLFGAGFESDVGRISGNYYFHYDKLFVPANGVVVFEVTLRMNGSGYDAGVGAVFNELNHSVICPYVQLEIPTSPIKVSDGQLSRTTKD
jgi:hypothetical protein